MCPAMFAIGLNQQQFTMQIPAQQMQRRMSPFPPRQHVTMEERKVTPIRSPHHVFQMNPHLINANSPTFLPHLIYSPMQRIITPIGRMPLFF